PLGESLPHWNVAAAVYDPGRWHADGRWLRMTLGAVILLSLGAIGLGGWLVLGDARRPVDLARKQSELVSNVSHELRTPLTSIRRAAERLAEGVVADEPKRRQHLALIRDEASRLRRLISHVLDCSCLERGEKRLHRRPVNLAAIVGEVLESFSAQLL